MRKRAFCHDAVYGLELQETILNSIAFAAKPIRLKNSELRFYGNDVVKQYVTEHEKIKPRILSAEQSNTSVIYDNRFFLKIFRKVDKAVNPDLEITQFLTEYAHFPNIPAYVGAMEWRYENGAMVLAMMQEMITSSSDAWTYMLDRLDTFNEHILSHTDPITPPGLRGTLLRPVEYEDIPEQMKDFIEGTVAEQASLLGVRTGEMHKALASSKHIADFNPEPYSLHYQRSLYSGLQSLVRGTFQNQTRMLRKLRDDIRQEATEVLAMKERYTQHL